MRTNRTKLFLCSFFVAAAAALFGLAGCSPSEKTELVITENKNGGEVLLKTGQVLTVRLESNPTTGYSWAVTGCDETVLRPEGDPQYVAEPLAGNRAGAGGWEVFHFQPTQAGETHLELAYRRPWETDVEPVEVFSVAVTVEQTVK
jgi:inhibitor of cysteine peptidase